VIDAGVLGSGHDAGDHLFQAHWNDEFRSPRGDYRPGHAHCAALEGRSVRSGQAGVVYGIASLYDHVALLKLEDLHIGVCPFDHLAFFDDVPCRRRRGGRNVGRSLPDEAEGLIGLVVDGNIKELFGNKGIGNAAGNDYHAVLIGLLDDGTGNRPFG